jgi:hypothetical protein
MIALPVVDGKGDAVDSTLILIAENNLKAVARREVSAVDDLNRAVGRRDIRRRRRGRRQRKDIGDSEPNET